MRLCAGVFLLGIISSNGFGAPVSPETKAQERNARAILQRAQLPSANFEFASSKKTDQSLGASLRKLESRPFVRRTSALYTNKQRIDLATDGIADYLNASKLAGPVAQKRVDGVLRKLWKAGGRELRIQPNQAGPRGGNSMVLEGGNAAGMNASMDAAGAVLVHRDTIGVSTQLGHALAYARDPSDLQARIAQIVQGAYRPRMKSVFDPRVVRPLADSVLAAVLSHEITHGLKRDPGSVALSDANKGLARSRVAESIADLGGVELSTRAGFSPKGQLAIHLYMRAAENAAAPAPQSVQIGGMESDHPSGNARYAAVYRYLKTKGPEPRRMYDQAKVRLGAPLLRAEQIKELEQFPAP